VEGGLPASRCRTGVTEYAALPTVATDDQAELVIGAATRGPATLLLAPRSELEGGSEGLPRKERA
jgi:hypothetical protein